jgi:hypothetical protein
VRTRALTTALVLLLALAGCTAGSGGTADVGQPAAQASAAARQPGSTDPGTDGLSTPKADASEPTPVPSVSGSSGGQTDGDASEIIPEASPKPSSLADLLPSDPPAARRLTKLPASSIAVAGLAKGFPRGVLFVPDDAKVVSSAVTTNMGRSQLTLDAAVSQSCSSILADLRAWYTSGGFKERARTRETATRADLAFTRDDAHVTIAAVTMGKSCRLTQSGVLAAGAGS